jgi:hypothetical protein
MVRTCRKYGFNYLDLDFLFSFREAIPSIHVLSEAVITPHEVVKSGSDIMYIMLHCQTM